MGGSFEWTPAARLLASSITPALALCVVFAQVVDRRWRNAPALPTGRWLAAGAVGIAATVALAELGKHLQIWCGHSEFPSGHESFATAAAAALVVRDRRWSIVACPLALIIGWALVAAGFHAPIEVVAGMALGAVVSGSLVVFISE